LRKAKDQAGRPRQVKKYSWRHQAKHLCFVVVGAAAVEVYANETQKNATNMLMGFIQRPMTPPESADWSCLQRYANPVVPELKMMELVIRTVSAPAPTA
jgi:hypothetical protein